MKIRFLTLFLCIVCCLVPTLASCNPAAPADTGNGGTITGDVESEEQLVLPDGMNYDGQVFNVLSAGNVAYDDFSYTEEAAGFGIVPEAQYIRIQTMKEKYGVVIATKVEVNKKSYGDGPGYQMISKAVQSETVDYHLGIIGGYDVACLAKNNLLFDINSVEWIDTEKSWWDQNANEDLSLNGLLLFTNGSLTAAYSESTFALFFNKDLAKTVFNDGQDPYQLVKDGKWTVDVLAELSRLVSEDLDGDGQITYKDRFGLWTWDDSMIGIIEAAGSKICTVNDDGTVSLTLYNDNTVNMFNKYIDIAYDKQYALAYQAEMRAGRMTSADVFAAWGEGKTLFWANSTGIIPTIRELETNFGILPYPKLSEEQERYYSTIAPYNSQFICIPYYQEETEFVGSVTEALAYYGKEIVTPAVYEKALKGAYARDEESYEMLDIIFGSYGYDFGNYYRVGSYPDQLLNLLRNKSNALSSVYNAYKAPAESELAALNANFAYLYEVWEKN